MNKEFRFLNIINNTLKDSSYLGDDCGYLDEYKLAISSDTLVENVHFSLCFMSAYEIARKSLLVNISDILASGAKPIYVTISLSGALDDNFVQDFYNGVNSIAKEYEIKIVGGDLTKSDKITVGITILGSYKDRNISSRKNAQDGYIVAVVGEFGSSAQGLEDLFHGIMDNYFINYHKNPKLYPNISYEIASKTTKPYAMMDSSDGLIDCLSQISAKSNVRIDIEYDKIPHKTTNPDFVLSGGEDYALVVCIDKEDFKNIDGLIQIGTCSIGSGVYLDGKKIEYKGYNHFE